MNMPMMGSMTTKNMGILGTGGFHKHSPSNTYSCRLYYYEVYIHCCCCCLCSSMHCGHCHSLYSHPEQCLPELPDWNQWHALLCLHSKSQLHIFLCWYNNHSEGQAVQNCWKKKEVDCYSMIGTVLYSFLSATPPWLSASSPLTTPPPLPLHLP